MRDESILAGRVSPCPFCGGTRIVLAEGSTFRWVAVECLECEARCGEVRALTRSDPAQAIEDAINEWNLRA
jgi:Lar family restriction alleviation protein